MTTMLPQQSGEIKSLSFPEGVPPYTPHNHDVQVQTSTINKGCSHEKKNQTPLLDAYMQRPEVQARILAVSEALSDVTHGKSCTKCATKTAVQELYAQMYEMKAAKKSGEWTSEERKAIKKEAKGLINNVSGELKMMWKMKS